MGQIRIEIFGISPDHGCDRRAKEGEKLYNRCKRLDCIDCRTYDFVQTLRQLGFSVGEANFIHYAGATTAEVVDDLRTNSRKKGQF